MGLGSVAGRGLWRMRERSLVSTNTRGNGKFGRADDLGCFLFFIVGFVGLGLIVPNNAFFTSSFMHSFDFISGAASLSTISTKKRAGVYNCFKV